MAYKVGTTIVIDDTGSVPWARISGAPAAGLAAGEYTKSATEYKTAGSGAILSSTTFIGLEFQSDLTYHDIYLRTYTNCNCNCQCYC